MQNAELGIANYLFFFAVITDLVIMLINSLASQSAACNTADL